MSFYTDDFFMEDTIKYGLNEIINQRVNGYFLHHNKRNIIHLIAGLDTNKQVYERVIKSIIDHNLEIMISRYAKFEYLPTEFVLLAKEEYGLFILLKIYLKKNGYILNQELIKEIEDNIQEVERNLFNKSIYDRVAQIQNFIYEKIQQKNGSDAHRKLNKKEMKNLLSTCRLYLNLYDLNNNSIRKTIENWRKNDEFIQEEYENPTKVKLEAGKKFIPIWKARNMRLLMDYTSIDETIVLDIMNIDQNQPVRDYKNEIVVYMGRSNSEIYMS